MSATQSSIGSPNTTDDQTIQTIDTVFKLAANLAPIGDTVAILAGADAEDVAVGTRAVVSSLPGIESLLQGLFSIFGHHVKPAAAPKSIVGPAAGA